MSDPITPLPPNPSGSTLGIRRTVPTQHCSPSKCETAISIGIFFDGTGNSLDGAGNSATKWQHQQMRKQSNVARLFRAYPDKPMEGFFRLHVAGLGTPLADIGELEPAKAGAGFGSGGDGRINYGLLYLFNAVHQVISGDRRLDMYSADTVKALCRNGRRSFYIDRAGQRHYSILEGPEDQAALDRVGMGQTGGLLMSTGGDRSVAKTFYAAQAGRLANLIANVADKPILKEIFIDVFGFSRGAAEARSFCSWLNELFQGDRLFGVVAHIRFMGLFDSVAAVGVNASAGLGAEGHMSWADAPYLRIPTRVRHCEHYVAMHENRPSFPVELVAVDGVKPSNCREFVYPGMHSDVGGGYFPHEQGRWWGDIARPALPILDSMKLSQIPLNHMLLAAKAAGVPLSTASAVDENRVSYMTIHPAVQAAFDAFMVEASSPRPLRDWMTEYLSWRYQVRSIYAELVTTRRADPKDRDDLVGANKTLLDDIEALEDAKSFWTNESSKRRVSRLAPEAPELLEKLKKAAPTSPAKALVFMYLVHDSYAGFRPFDEVKVWGWDPIPGSWEAEGLIRYRRRYEGSDKSLARLQPQTESASVLT